MAYRRKEVKPRSSDPPLTQTYLSNHKPMHMECPRMAAALQTAER